MTHADIVAIVSDIYCELAPLATIDRVVTPNDVERYRIVQALKVDTLAALARLDRLKS